MQKIQKVINVISGDQKSLLNFENHLNKGWLVVFATPIENWKDESTHYGSIIIKRPSIQYILEC